MSYWTLVITQANKERLAVQNIANQGYEYYLPLFREKTSKGDVVKVLFSRYLFVKVYKQWASLTGTYGVSGIVMDGVVPKKVPESILTKLKHREDENGFVILEEKEGLRSGDSVKILEGPMKDAIGIYQGMTTDERSIVLFKLLGSDRNLKVNPNLLTVV
jgi:transcriptional antiterminator RfaH